MKTFECIAQNIEKFLGEVLTIESKKQVLTGRASGETLAETAQRLNVTFERVRQIEAKITRRFSLSKEGQHIISALANINTAEELKSHCGEYYPQTVYLLRLYKESFFYNNEPLDKFDL